MLTAVPDVLVSLYIALCALVSLLSLLFQIFLLGSCSMPESIGHAIEKACQSIFPLQNVCIRKVKVLRKPKFDLVKLMELHGDSGEDTGAALDKVAAETTVEALSGAGGRL